MEHEKVFKIVLNLTIWTLLLVIGASYYYDIVSNKGKYISKFSVFQYSFRIHLLLLGGPHDRGYTREAIMDPSLSK